MLSVFCEEMNKLQIPYEFMRWTGEVSYPYFVGEYTQSPTLNEDGYREYSILLDGFTRGSWMDLEDCKNKIENHFPSVGGLSRTTENGTVVFYFDRAIPVDTGQAELKRIQIDISVKEWRKL